ncbi:DUF998 domain-containing protein [Candidatus Bathyarchaeota archaeon]|nr:DUF998 domain-containing protein [Candidatus Bathyarchaeota archaeon]
MNVKIVRVMARFGTPSPVIGLGVIGLSIIMTPTWSMMQPLSDLGAGGFGSVMYTNGMLMTGALAMLLAAGLFEYTSGDPVGQIGSAAFLVYAFLTCALGIVIIDWGVWYNYFTDIVFLMIPLSSAILSYSFYTNGPKNQALIGILPVVFGIATWALGGPVNAQKELLALIPFGIWQIAIGLHMYGLKTPNEFD